MIITELNGRFIAQATTDCGRGVYWPSYNVTKVDGRAVYGFSFLDTNGRITKEAVPADLHDELRALTRSADEHNRRANQAIQWEQDEIEGARDDAEAEACARVGNH